MSFIADVVDVKAFIAGKQKKYFAAAGGVDADVLFERFQVCDRELGRAHARPEGGIIRSEDLHKAFSGTKNILWNLLDIIAINLIQNKL